MLLLLDASPRVPAVCPAVTEDTQDLVFGSPGHGVLACFSPPCFSTCCSAAPTNVSSVALSETSPTHATNRTGKYQSRHPGGAGTTPRSVSPLRRPVSPAPSRAIPLRVPKRTCRLPFQRSLGSSSPAARAETRSSGAERDCQAEQPCGVGQTAGIRAARGKGGPEGPWHGVTRGYAEG